MFLVGAAVFFLIFGGIVLVYSYHLNDPFSFIITFFSANLIILISGVMVAGFVIRIIRVVRVKNKDEEE